MIVVPVLRSAAYAVAGLRLAQRDERRLRMAPKFYAGLRSP